MTTGYTPTAAFERIRTLDVVRGTALLGILLMNILTFGMPLKAYANLNLWGGRDGLDLWTFVVQWIFFEGKMRALFSMMFGAGIAIFLQRAIAREDRAGAADLFVRRMSWLMLFGILHAWLIWYGDIIYAYGVCGVFLFPYRTMRPRSLCIVAAAGLLFATAMLAGDGYSKYSKRAAAMQARALEAAGQTLTTEQRDAKTAWDETWNEVMPPRSELQEEVDGYRSGYVGAIKERAEVVVMWHFIPVYFPVLADFWAMMLLGMALYKLGVLQGERPPGFYVTMAAVGYAIAVPVNAASTWFMVAYDFDPVASAVANVPHQLGRVAMALAHMAVIVIVVQRGWLRRLTDRLAAVGQTALTNYIGTSVLCSVIFYKPGFALMGQLQRHELYYVVAVVWVVNLAWSKWWLTRYQFGPLEWCWRSLTYWRRQPMRRSPGVVAAHAIV
jgi:uncharacterized protein